MAQEQLDNPEEPRIVNLVYDELGELVVRKINERFDGIRGLEFPVSFERNDPVTYSSLPRSLAVNQILAEEGVDMHVPSIEEVVRYKDSIPDRQSTNSDTGAIVISPSELLKSRGYSLEARTFMGFIKNYAVGIMWKEVKRTWSNRFRRKKILDVPLIINGLGIECDDRYQNRYGFNFKETERTTIKEAPYLIREGKTDKGVLEKRVEYDSENDQLVSSEKGMKLVISLSHEDRLHVVQHIGSSQRISGRGEEPYLVSAAILNYSDEGRVIQLVDNRS
jgi:hypothetical protein